MIDCIKCRGGCGVIGIYIVGGSMKRNGRFGKIFEFLGKLNLYLLYVLIVLFE